MLVRLLGPIELTSAGRPVRLGGAKQRSALAVLAVAGGRTVSVDELVDALWGDTPPPTATKTVQTYVSRLRALVGERLVSNSSGYTLDIDVDVAAVQQLVAEARACAAHGETDRAVALFGEALAWWVGDALGGTTETARMAGERARLDELRRFVEDERAEALLARGDAASVVSDLEASVAAEPLRERRWGLLMVALYRSGRQSEALRAFQRLRSTLAGELGIDPSSELVDLERQILERDPRLDLRLDGPGAKRVEEPVSGHPPRQLPSGVVSFVLTDVVGSTQLWERDPRGMDDALRRHDTIIAATVNGHGGVLLKSKGEGDATFSVFARATDAALAAASSRRAFAIEEWPEGIALGVRFAVATGEAIERDGDYFGPTVNRAARLRSLAVGGEVLMSQSTVDVLVDTMSDGLRLLDRGELVLRGLGRPEHVWELIDDQDEDGGPDGGATSAPRSNAGPVRTPLPRLLEGAARAPILGRDRELAELSGLRGGRGRRVAWVRGEPGIGKTRLVAEVARAAHESGDVVLYGRCDETLGAPFQPFVEALRHWVAHAAPARLADATQYGRSHLARLLPELADGTVTSVDADQYAVFDAVDALVSSIADSGRLVFVLDDLHWADRSSLLLLRHLMRSIRSGDIVVLAVYRDTDLDRTHPLAELIADLRREVADVRVTVRGLAPDATAELLVAIGVDLDGDHLEAAVAETEGNPFFATEIARHLIDSVEPSGTSHGLPEGIREAVGRRLSRLSSATDEVLHVAAVVGREVGPEVLAAISRRSLDEVIDALEEATAAHVLEESTDRFGHYRFVHALVRQTLMEELSSTRRVRLHWAAGEVLCTLRPGDVAAIAGHLAEGVLAGDAAIAAAASRSAAAAAAAATAWDEAAAHDEQVIRLLDTAGLDEPRLRYDALLGFNEARRMLGEFQVPRRAARAAAEVARSQGWSTELAHAAFEAAKMETMGLRPGSRQLVDDALTALGTGESVERIRLEAVQLASEASASTVDVERWRTTCERARALVARADAFGDPEARFHARTPLGWALSSRAGTEERASTVAVQRELIDAETHHARLHLWRRFRVAIEVGGLARETGDAVKLREAMQRHDDILDRLPSAWAERSRWWWEMTDALASGRFDIFDLIVNDFGIDADDRGYAIVRWELVTRRSYLGGDVDAATAATAAVVDAGTPFSEMAHQLAAFAAAAGDVALARSSSAAAWERGLTYSYGRPRALSCAAEAAVRLGDRARAAELEPHLRPYDGTVLAPYGGHMIDQSAATALGQVEMVIGRFDEAVEHFRAGLEIEQRMGWDALAARTRVWWARALLMRGGADDRTSADRLLVEAESTGRRLGVGLVCNDVAWIRATLT